MTIQPISEVSVVLYLTPDDLQQRGLCAAELTAEQTLELTQTAFARSGLDPERILELEAYPEECGMLIFVYITPNRQSVWRFSDSETLLDGVAALREETDGALYWWEDSYLLVLPAPAICLAEFGTREDDEYIHERLREYATPLLEHNAPSVLKKQFAL